MLSTGVSLASSRLSRQVHRVLSDQHGAPGLQRQPKLDRKVPLVNPRPLAQGSRDDVIVVRGRRQWQRRFCEEERLARIYDLGRDRDSGEWCGGIC